MSKALRWLIATTILITGIIWLEHYLGWKTVLSAWAALPQQLLAALLLLTASSYALRAYRVHRYFFEHCAGAYHQTLRLSLQHNAINNFLPMRLGEASFPLLMKRHFGLSLARSSAGLLWIRLADLHCLSCLFLLSLYPSFGVLFLLAAALLLILPRLAWQLTRTHQQRLPQRWQDLLGVLQDYAPRDFKHWRQLYLLTLATWLSKLLALTAIMLAFIELPASQALLAVIGADFSSVLPIHGLAGSGTYEAAMLISLAPFQIESQTVIAAAVNVHLYLLASSLLSVLLALLIPSRKTTRHPAST